jgi:hypothetical protein
MTTRYPRLRTWNEADTAILKQMWWDGHRPETIAYALGHRSPRSIGDKAHAEGFKRNPELKLQGSPNLFEVPQFMLPALRAGGELVTTINVKRGECRWIESDEPGENAPMCGRETQVGRSFCEFHVKRVYVKGTPPPLRETPRC